MGGTIIYGRKPRYYSKEEVEENRRKRREYYERLRKRSKSDKNKKKKKSKDKMKPTAWKTHAKREEKFKRNLQQSRNRYGKTKSSNDEG